MNLFTLTTFFSVVCLSFGDPSKNISDFVRKGIQNCTENSSSSCHNNQFFDTDVTQISPSWFVFAAGLLWELESESEDPEAPVPGWQGAMHYRKPISADRIYELEHREGLYIYPDWSSCVEGVWENHILVQGEMNLILADQKPKTKKCFEYILSYLRH